MSTPLFAECNLNAVLNSIEAGACQAVDATEENYLLNVSENDFVAYLVSKHAVNPPQLGEPSMLEPKEVDIDVGYDPRYGRHYGSCTTIVRGYCVDIHIPFTGDSGFFTCRPSTYGLSHPHGKIAGDHIELNYSNAGTVNAADVKMLFEHDLQLIRTFVQNIESECNVFNSVLSTKIRQYITGRKSRIQANKQAATAIGVPLQRRANAPQSYAVPDIKRKPEIQRPAATQKAFSPEPVLIEQEYENVLTIIRSMVTVMERSPKAFGNMCEEDIRSHFLVQLNGQYQGRATGETFNYQGKTDILIREGERNVFIAECKIWKGEGELVKAIDQILGYLHWRDTKTALVIFNRNKSFSDVLAKVMPTIQSHPCCKKLLKQISETEWRFLFRNPDDTNRELQLAVLCFDVPTEAA